MYGMIHRAMRQMVLEQLGEKAWLALEQKLKIGPLELLTGMVYEDKLTNEIVSDAAARLNLTVDDCLVEFGKYWIEYADKGPLSTIMNFTGQNFASFVSNLDHMHLAVSAAMPGSRLPTFTTLENEKDHLLVEYRSDRVGMERFVYGLFLGLMERFGVQGHITTTDRGEKFIIFHIRYQDKD